MLRAERIKNKRSGALDVRKDRPLVSRDS